MLKAKAEANKQHATQPDGVIWRSAEQSAPTTDPLWDPDAWEGGVGRGGEKLEHYKYLLLKGMKAAVARPVN